jgi:plastocyanin
MLFSLLLGEAAFSQCTPVDCLASLPPIGGLCAADFLEGRVNEPYFDAISFHVTNACSPASVFDPAQTSASVRITQLGSFTFTNLPAGLSGATNQQNYNPPANGCGALSGTPTEAGIFNATVGILANVNAWPFSLTCSGIGPLPQNGQSITEERVLVILPDPSFSGADGPYCVTDAVLTLTPTGTPGGTFSGPGVSGSSFDPAIAGVGSHTITYEVSAQQGAAIAPATDSFSIVVEVNDACLVVCEADAGTLSGGGSVCLEDGSANLTATVDGNALVPVDYTTAYALTEGAGLVIINAGATPEFTVDAEGDYTIHTLVYDPNTLDLGIIEFGVTTGFDVNALLEQGGGDICASLDVAGAAFTVELCVVPCDADAGTLSGGGTVCLEDGSATLLATADGNAIVPVDYTIGYVLTEGAGLVIIDLNTVPEFSVDAEGEYTIHSLVGDPNSLDLSFIEFGVTTGFDVNALLIQGGGDICASLDVAGAAFTVELCVVPCDANAGTLSGGGSVCFEDGSATLTATPDGNTIVPVDYTTAYVLTEGAGLVIINAGSSPEFTVAAEGDYTIHTLVYDPSTLDLGIIEFGVTTGFDVNSLLVQGGGDICASLDVTGAVYIVELCSDPCGADAGTLSGGGVACLESGFATLIATTDGNAVVPTGYDVYYILTSGVELVIQDGSETPEFTVDAVGVYTIHTFVYEVDNFDFGLIQVGVTTGSDVNALLVQGGGDICASLDVAGAAFSVEECIAPCDADAGTLSGGGVVCFDNGSATMSATADGNAVVPVGYDVYYLLTSGAGLVILDGNVTPEFTVDAVGTYTIHTFVYETDNFDFGLIQVGVTTGFDVNALLIQGGGDICASLDVAGAAFNVQVCCPSDAGTLSDGGTVCFEDGSATLTATADGNAVEPAGYTTAYVLTEGAGLVIIAAGGTPEFIVDAVGNYTIHTLVFDPNTLDINIVEFGVTTGFDVNALLVQGGGDICASLDVTGAAFTVALCCDADAGTLSGGDLVCFENNEATLSASIEVSPVVPVGFSTVYVLTEGAGLVIVDAAAAPEFVVDAEGDYTIHTLVYDPNTLDISTVEFGVTTGFDVNALLIQGGGTICASLDVAGTAFSVEVCPEPCDALAGTLTPGPAETCLDNGEATLSATADGNAVVPTDYSTVYVLTEGAGLVILQAGADPEFTVTAEGDYTIHTLVYDPNTLDLGIIEFGVTTGFDVNGLLIQGGGTICASLDVTGAAFTVEECVVVCDAAAGTLSGGGTVCFEAGSATLAATADGNAVVPTGYSTVYVLTEGAGLVILQAGADPEFTVTAEGDYTIHTLVYDPNTLDLGIIEFGVTSGFDVNGLLIQGGGTICASLDVAGAAFTVEECVVVCDAAAGTLSGGGTVCFEAGSATLTATADGNAVVPTDYSTVYVLTEGAGLVILQAGADPDFTVTAEGDYTIHTLVYDPNTLDLGIIEFGVTTGFDVNGLLIQGGGTICASLDVTGAAFTVEECVVVCDAAAGTLSGGGTVCFEAGSATLTATADGNAVVPTGYSTVYVLTEGAGLVILEAGADPEFTVTAEGDYTIHTLVYDPNTLDLSIVVPGVTTGFEINNLLIQGGGDICASLDVVGAAFTVEECVVVCDALAGTLSGGGNVCLVANEAVLTATADGNAVVPTGYSTVYVLTQGAGLVIIDAGATPEFTVNAAGTYTIHTLVHDPNTLDLAIVEFGVTTGFDVNALLLQGGGDICASLDVAGAAFIVEECIVTCDADAGTLSGGGLVCLSGGVATLTAVPDGNAVVPTGYLVAYGLSFGPDLIIQDAGLEPSFIVNAEGDYGIHTLIFDANTLDLTFLELGVTTGAEIDALLIQGGGTICGSLDLVGAPFTVEICSSIETNELANGFQVYPNPTNGDFSILAGIDAKVVVELMDATGRVVYTEQRWSNSTTPMQITLGGSLTPGMYVLRLSSDLGRSEQRIVVQQ